MGGERPPDRDRRFDAAQALRGTVFELDDGDSSLGLDDLFAALSHPRRLCLVAALAEHSCGTSLSTLATTVAARERGEAPDSDVRDRVYASLYHTHVPKLVDLGVLGYDADSDVVVKTGEAERVEAALEGATAALNADRRPPSEQRVD